MESVPDLAQLGRRIMIMGPSNAGKSTLAVALGERLSIAVHHLDIFRHRPQTDWQQRSDAEFRALHDDAIAGDEWIIEGNYTALLPQRLARATGIVVLDDTLLRRYARYFRRSLLLGTRAGALPGGNDGIKWSMIHWLWHTRHASRRMRDVAKQSGLPSVLCSNERDLGMLYAAWGLA